MAKLEPATLYPYMSELNRAKITVINFYQAEKRIYCLYLCPIENHDTFMYSGYTDVSQLGKYFSVTIEGAKTRIYSMVNFLQRSTIKIVEQIAKGELFDEDERTAHTK